MDFNRGTPRSVTFPAGVAGSTRCIEIDIIDDNVQENDEGFNVDFEFVNGMGARKGAIPQTMVVIVDNDSKFISVTWTPSLPAIFTPSLPVLVRVLIMDVGRECVHCMYN